MPNKLSWGARRPTLIRSAALAAILGAIAAASGCAMIAPKPRCGHGETLADGQCVPTPSIVFARCMDAFRKTHDEHETGTQTKVGVRAKGYGGAAVQHGKHEADRAQYAGVPDALLSDALLECRRQEQKERDQEIARAWTEAEAQEAAAEQARQEAKDAQALAAARAAEAERLAQALQLAQDAHDGLAAALAESEQARAQQTARIEAMHPCAAEQWDRCGEQALASKQAGDYARAHELFALSCDGQDAKSCVNWGVMFEEGLGTPPDPAAAHRKYAQGCRLGNASACASQGIMAMQGLGTTRDPQAAAELLSQACGQDIFRACAPLGRLAEQGKVTRRRDAWTPDRLYAHACTNGEPQGCLWLGEWHHRGTDSASPAPDKAAKSYARACELGNARGCLRLAELHETGDGVGLDHARALALSARACESGLGSACATAQRLSDDREVVGVELH